MRHDSNFFFYSVIRDVTPLYMWHGSRTTAHFTVIWCFRFVWVIHVARLSLSYDVLKTSFSFLWCFLWWKRKTCDMNHLARFSKNVFLFLMMSHVFLFLMMFYSKNDCLVIHYTAIIICFERERQVEWLRRNTVTFRVGAISCVTWLCVWERVVCLVCVWQSRVCTLCCVRLCVLRWCNFMCDMTLSCVSWPIHVLLTRVNVTFEK